MSDITMDDDASLSEFSLQNHLLDPLFAASKSPNPKQTLEILIATSKTDDGRADLASRNILPAVLSLIQSLPYPSAHIYLLLSLRLLRNLCAGEIANQNSFIKLNGVGIVSNVLRCTRTGSDPDIGFIRAGLQVLANVCLAGEEHQQTVWHQLFPNEFAALAAIRSRETCDPLCMIMYVCCDGIPDLVTELCGDLGLPIVAEIVRTASVVGFGEDWFKLLLSRVCLEGIYLPQLFSGLFCVDNSANSEDINLNGSFSAEQAYLLSVISGVLSQQIGELSVPNDFALCVFGIFTRSVGAIDSVSRAKSGLPTGSTTIDVLGYSLTILRDVCAGNSGRAGLEKDLVDVVGLLFSYGLLELLLCLLRDLEPPALIKKAMKHGQNQEITTTSCSPKLCPYKGFRRDIVAVIGNCAYRRKRVHDEVRKKNGILLILQHCVTDEENPFLREWGIWSVRNLLEGNAENQQAVAELELQGSVDVPELSGLGLKVEVDQKTRRAKLVNVS